jgi:hypothetical protein
MKNIPVVHVSGRSNAQAYDRPGDPESIDATMDITVDEPWADP